MTSSNFVSLGEIVELSNGANFTKADHGSGIKILGVGDFQDRVLADWSSVDEVRRTAVTSDRQLLAEGDIVFVRSNGNRRLVGRSLLVPAVDEATHSAFTIRARPNQERVVPRYLAYVCRGLHRSGAMGHANGTNITNLNQQILAGLKVPLPTLEVQEDLAVAIGGFDDLIGNNRRRIEILEEMARLLYREWFVHFRFPGHEGVELVDSELGPIPEGWEVEPTGKVFDAVGGGTPSKKVDEYWVDGDIEWFTPSDLTKSSQMFAFSSGLKINEAGLVKSSAKIFPAGSVMLTSRATIGEIAIATLDATTNQGFITCVPNERVTTAFLYFWLGSNVDRFLQLAGGATFKELRKSTFREMPLAVPPERLMTEFTATVSAQMALIANLIEQNRVLREARDLLLPRLVSGELDVSELDLDGVLA